MKQLLRPLILIPLLLYLFIVPIVLLFYSNNSLASVIESVKEVAGVSTVSLPPSPTPLPEKIITQPYGVTNSIVTQDTIVQVKNLGVSWIRLPMLWSSIETGPHAYDWTQLDTIVSLVNQNNLHIDFVIANPPPWNAGVCKDSTKAFGFTPEAMSSFGAVLASRYNGESNHGFIDAYEIGNDEFDTFGSDTLSSDVACRKPEYYVPILKAGYTALKKSSHKSLIGMFGMGGNSKQKIVSYLDGLYMSDPTISKFFDFGNIHYYNTIVETKGDPAKTIPSDPDYATFSEKILLMQQTFNQFNDTKKPLWVSEIGWKQPFVTQQIQSSYLSTVMLTAKQLKVEKIFWFSVDSDNYGLFLQSKPSLSAQVYQQFTQKNPTW